MLFQRAPLGAQPSAAQTNCSCEARHERKRQASSHQPIPVSKLELVFLLTLGE